MATQTNTAGRSNSDTFTHPNSDRETAVGVFHSHHEAQKAVQDLKAAGYSDDDIGIASQDREWTYKEQTEGNHGGEGAAAGAAAGFGAGALWGLGIVAGVLPAIEGSAAISRAIAAS